MSPLRLPARSDERRELHDDVRGARTFWFDGSLPVEAVLATGEHLRFVRDGDELRAIEVDGEPFLAIAPLPDGVTRFTNADTRTDLSVAASRGDRLLVCNGQTLEIRHDTRGRLDRVVVPGSLSPIEYCWTRESCSIAPAGGAPLVTIDVAGDAMRVTLADAGCGWRESAPFDPAPAITAFDRAGNEIGTCALIDDPMRRPAARRWNDGDEDRWQRDDAGRLASWTRVRAGASEQREFRYGDAGDLVDDGAAHREIDAGHRVTTLARPGGEHVRYRYDAAGRRVARIDASGLTTYEYDVLGQLTRVITPGDEIRMTYDGLGRRVAVQSSRGVLFEHRDTGGRLWAVTDAAGRAVHTFLWFGGRIIARIDGDSDNAVAEGYLTDQGGTLIAVLTAGGRLERAGPPPFGAVSAPMRPTLYGHFGDPATGLIHFGARDLDPELGLFLTPDPWSGGDDDPRLWDGLAPEQLRQTAELPAATAHPYALCHFDPVGRTDLDGHFTDCWGIFRTIMLGTTWGTPLTSLSLLFFLPVDIYFDLIFGFFFLIYKLCHGDAVRTPWSKFHFWKAIHGAASARQGVFALGLNGLLPRRTGGPDRAMTIGHVIWVHPDTFDELERPRVLDIWNIGGAPKAADGLPDGVNAFNADSSKESIVAVTGADAAGNNKQVHMARWTRGFGNAVLTVPITGTQYFVDRRLGTEVNVPGSIHLLTPMPLEFPYPAKNDAKEVLSVQEYIHDPALHHNTADVELATTPAATIQVPTKKLAKTGDVLEIAAPRQKPIPPPVFARIGQLSHDLIEGFAFDEKIDTLFLDHALPAGFKKDLTVRRIVPGGAAGNWGAIAGNDQIIELPAAGDPIPAAPPKVVKNDLLQIEAAPPDMAWSRVTSVQLTIALTTTMDPDLPAVGTDVTLLHIDGAVFNGTAMADGKLHLAAGHPSIKKDDLLLVTIGGGEVFALVTAVNGDDVSVQPGMAAFGPGAAAKVERYVETDAKKDMAKTVSAAALQLVVATDRADLFKSGNFLAYGAGAKRTFRKVDKISNVRLSLSHKVAGAGPYQVKYASVDKTFDLSGIEVSAQMRILRHTGGTLPSAFGAYPNSIIAIRPDTRGLDGAVFFIKGPLPAGFDAKFRKMWQPQTTDGTEHFFLFEDLPIKEVEVKGVTQQRWQYDTWFFDITAPPPLKFKVVEFHNIGAARSDVNNVRIVARPCEVQVPAFPQVHDTNSRALKEHELHHAVQNSKWGPLLGTLPIQMIFKDIALGTVVAGEQNPAPWLKEWFDEAKKLENEGLAWSDLFSIGGLLHYFWKYVFSTPAKAFDSLQAGIKETKFEDWNKFFKIINPLGLLLDLIPSPRPDMPDRDRWITGIVKLFQNACDIRSWTLIGGWIPIWIHDNPKNFIEQQASRASGNKYSTILSVDDKFNMTLDFARDSRDANVTRVLGQSARVLVGSHQDADCYFVAGFGQQQDSPMNFLSGGKPRSVNTPVFRIEPVTLPAGSPKTLFHAALFKEFPVAAATPVTTLNIDGPVDPVTGARPLIELLQADTTNDLEPQLRSFVPMPPRVNRSAGFYFIPAAPGQYKITGAYIYDLVKRDPTIVADPAERAEALKSKHFADTEHATITVTGGDVKLGDIDIPWKIPPAVGSPPPLAAEMFITETLRLAVRDARGGNWILDLNPLTGHLTPTPDGTAAWKVRADTVAPVHVRIFRRYEKNDAAFDLKFDDTPTLKGVLSYLGDPIDVPIRVFMIDIKDIPKAYPDARLKTNKSHEISTPIALAGEQSIIITRPPGAPDLPRNLTGKAPPRGQKWTIGPPATPVAAATEYKVKVVFSGAPPRDSNTFKLTFEP